MKKILKKLEVNRDMNEVIQLEYDAEYFKFGKEKKELGLAEKKEALLKRVMKDSNPHINWLKKSLGFV